LPQRTRPPEGGWLGYVQGVVAELASIEFGAGASGR